MSRVSQRDQQSLYSNTSNTIDPSFPISSKIEEVRIQNLQEIISMLCQLMNQFIKIIDAQEIIMPEKYLSSKSIVVMKEANNQLKYHEKIYPIAFGKSKRSISIDIDQIIQMLTKMKIKNNQNTFPKVRKFDQYGSPEIKSQLSTITEKQSQENLLHNYLRKNMSNKRRSKTNIGKNAFLSGISSIEDLQFQVIREQTRKSLDNPYHKNNTNRKGLYNDLQKIKGHDNLLPAVKSYLDKHPKYMANIGKAHQYQIQKLI